MHVVGAFDEADADRVARSVAHSLVVRSTVAGRHASWSHIVSSIGYADALFMRERVSVDVMGVPVLRRGALCPFDEQRLLREAGDREIVIRVDLGAGGAQTTYWTGDLPPG